MVRVVDGARSSITPESSPKPVSVPRFKGTQRISTLLDSLQGASTLVSIDGSYYDITIA